MNAELQNGRKRFIGYAVALCFLGVCSIFIHTGLQTEHMNIIHTFVTEEGGGWSANATMLPMTIASLISIALIFVFGTLFVKYGVRKTMVPFMILTGLSCAGIALANGLDCYGGKAAGNYPLFFISIFVSRCVVTVFSMGSIMLLSNWVIRYRGRLMSILSAGATLFTVVGTSLMPNVIARSWHGDYRPFYYGMGVLCILMALFAILLLKDTPEDAGLFPDGADHAPLSEEDQSTHMTVKEVLTDINAWKLIGVLGCSSFIITGMMSSMALRFIELGGQELWLSATVFISAGAIAGIIFGFAFGFLTDRIGALKAELVYFLAILIPLFSLLFMPKEKSVIVLVILAFGLAVVLGGAPTTLPCLTAHVYGRLKYQSANRITQAIMMIPSAFSGLVMTALIQSSHGNVAYIFLLIVCAGGMVVLFTMFKIPDANAADRSNQ